MADSLSRNFDHIWLDLEEILHQLRRATDPKTRIDLLADMRVLLNEADRAVKLSLAP